MLFQQINYTISIAKIHSNKLNYLKSMFTKDEGLGYINNVVAKSTAEPDNSNNLTTANNSTPLKRAYIVCRTRTPKEKINNLILSMVTCSGKASPCYKPLFIVYQTAIRYRPKLINNAVTFKNSTNHNGAE